MVRGESGVIAYLFFDFVEGLKVLFKPLPPPFKSFGTSTSTS
jgi:hypothetical protein